MCTRPVSIRVPHNPYETNVLGLQGYKIVTVPCGKCPECLSKRQNDISVRAYRCAKQYGNCSFVTFTYNPQSVPFAQSLLDINKQTGEIVLHHVPELVSSPELLADLRLEYHKHQSGVFYSYRDFVSLVGNDDCQHLYQFVYTPTLCYRHFALRLKNFRVDYQRKVGNLDFKYIVVGEYGCHKSHRPHFHVLFFGLSRFQVDYLCSFWDLGNYFVEEVKFINEDGSDGLSRVASYIGKYAAKGSFNPSSVTQHLTLPCRLCSSRGLGLSDLEPLISYYRCYDLVKYDINDFKFDDENIIFTEILSRLKSYEFNGKSIPLPESIRRKIFGYKVVDGKACWSLLYYKVVDFARINFEEDSGRKFLEFVSRQTEAGFSLSEACFRFNALSQNALKIREQNEREYLSAIYSRSTL